MKGAKNVAGKVASTMKEWIVNIMHTLRVWLVTDMMATFWGKLMGPLATRIKAIMSYFYNVVRNVFMDPAVKAAFQGFKNADWVSIRDVPGPLEDNLVWAMGDAIFKTAILWFNRHCLNYAATQKDDPEGGWLFAKFKTHFPSVVTPGMEKFATNVQQGIKKVTGKIGKVMGISPFRRELLDDGTIKASDALQHLYDNNLLNSLSREDTIALQNAYAYEYEANGNVHPNPEVEEELGVERPDLGWHTAHGYTKIHKELHPDSTWKSPYIEEHAVAAHEYYKKHGDKHHHLGAGGSEKFYTHNPHLKDEFIASQAERQN